MSNKNKKKIENTYLCEVCEEQQQEEVEEVQRHSILTTVFLLKWKYVLDTSHTHKNHTDVSLVVVVVLFKEHRRKKIR